MTTARYIEEEGQRYAVIPANEYEDLLDDLDDLRMLPKLEAMAAAVENGEVETFPMAFSEALSEAESTGELIRLWREYRQMSKVSLGKAIGSTGQYIGMLERGERDGTLSTVKAISEALCCDMDDLIP